MQTSRWACCCKKQKEERLRVFVQSQTSRYRVDSLGRSRRPIYLNRFRHLCLCISTGPNFSPDYCTPSLPSLRPTHSQILSSIMSARPRAWDDAAPPSATAPVASPAGASASPSSALEAAERAGTPLPCPALVAFPSDARLTRFVFFHRAHSCHRSQARSVAPTRRRCWRFRSSWRPSSSQGRLRWRVHARH